MNGLLTKLDVRHHTVGNKVHFESSGELELKIRPGYWSKCSDAILILGFRSWFQNYTFFLIRCLKTNLNYKKIQCRYFPFYPFWFTLMNENENLRNDANFHSNINKSLQRPLVYISSNFRSWPTHARWWLLNQRDMGIWHQKRITFFDIR